MPRAVDEWIGKTDDSAIPARVRLRIFDRYDGKCWISGRKIMSGDLWDCDHIVALINGGEHREYNLAPALRDKHREKTKQDVAEKAATAKVRMKHLGIKKANGRPMAGTKASGIKKGFDGRVTRR